MSNFYQSPHTRESSLFLEPLPRDAIYQQLETEKETEEKLFFFLRGGVT